MVPFIMDYLDKLVLVVERILGEDFPQKEVARNGLRRKGQKVDLEPAGHDLQLEEVQEPREGSRMEKGRRHAS